MAAILYLLVGLLLLSQRRAGERSRMILVRVTFLSMCNYIWMVVAFQSGTLQGVVMEVPYLLLGLFFITVYIIYPIEMISPGWLTYRRIVKMCTPVTVVLRFCILIQLIFV